MKNIPDWLVERIALDEVPPASKSRVDAADAKEIADRVAALRAENAAELEAYPPGPAIEQIEARVARARQQERRRRARYSFVALGMAGAGLVILLLAMRIPGATVHPRDESEEVTRVKGATRLSAFRQTGDKIEKLEEDANVKAGDLIQLRYSAGGARFGVIASIDGAGIVTLHHPVSEDAPAEATALAPKATALPNAYELDDAPDFERFFFITADQPIDVRGSVASLRAFAHRRDSATATLALPSGMNQTSLRLRKPSTQNTP